jgi:hypothetical protein
MQERPKIDSPISSDKEVRDKDKEERVANHRFYVNNLLTFLRDPVIMIMFLGKAVKNRELPLRASKESPGKREGPGSRKSIIVDPPFTVTLIKPLPMHGLLSMLPAKPVQRAKRYAFPE